MKDLAVQAYIDYLLEVVSKHEQVDVMKNEMIEKLKDRVSVQEHLIETQQEIITRLNRLVETK